MKITYAEVEKRMIEERKRERRRNAVKEYLCGAAMVVVTAIVWVLCSGCLA